MVTRKGYLSSTDGAFTSAARPVVALPGALKITSDVFVFACRHELLVAVVKELRVVAASDDAAVATAIRPAGLGRSARSFAGLLVAGSACREESAGGPAKSDDDVPPHALEFRFHRRPLSAGRESNCRGERVEGASVSSDVLTARRLAIERTTGMTAECMRTKYGNARLCQDGRHDHGRQGQVLDMCRPVCRGHGTARRAVREPSDSSSGRPASRSGHGGLLDSELELLVVPGAVVVGNGVHVDRVVARGRGGARAWARNLRGSRDRLR